MTDPGGHLAIRAGHENHLGRYAFGLRTAEYLICKTCGVYVAAICVLGALTTLFIKDAPRER